MSGVWVVLEERGGRIGRISWEAVAAGQQLASQLNMAPSYDRSGGVGFRCVRDAQ